MSQPQEEREKISDAPLALLLGLDQTEHVWALTRLPPPDELLMPVHEKTAIVESTWSLFKPTLPPHRVFRLRLDLRSSSHRWWNVYNDGRSRTAEDAFVYLEQKQ